MAMQDSDFQDLASVLKENRQQIVAEFKTCQGKSVDVGGYYKFDKAKVTAAMCPSPTLNNILSTVP